MAPDTAIGRAPESAVSRDRRLTGLISCRIPAMLSARVREICRGKSLEKLQNRRSDASCIKLMFVPFIVKIIYKSPVKGAPMPVHLTEFIGCGHYCRKYMFPLVMTIYKEGRLCLPWSPSGRERNLRFQPVA